MDEKEKPALPPEEDDSYCGELLQKAAIYNNVELLESLLEGPEKENINSQDSFGRTALYTSVTNDSYECSALLLRHGGLFLERYLFVL